MPPEASALVELRDVSVVFQRGATQTLALRGVRLAIRPAEYVVVIGPNGAGKSTLVNTIAGSVRPTRGVVAFRGQDVTLVPDYQRAAWIGRVFQDPAVGTCAGLTVAENAALAATRGRSRSPIRAAVTRRHVERVRGLLAQYGRDLERRLHQDVATLSGGQRQLLSVLMAVAGEPAILLLDEHTSALDPEVGQQVMQQTDAIIRGRGLTTVMVTHNMRLAAQYGDRLLVMSGGRIADDVRGAEKAALDEDRLIARFRERAGDVSDRLLA